MSFLLPSLYFYMIFNSGVPVGAENMVLQDLHYILLGLLCREVEIGSREGG